MALTAKCIPVDEHFSSSINIWINIEIDLLNIKIDLMNIKIELLHINTKLFNINAKILNIKTKNIKNVLLLISKGIRILN